MLEAVTSLNQIIGQAGLLIPEVILLCGALLILLVDLIIKNRHHPLLHWIFVISIMFSGAYSIYIQLPLDLFEPVYVWDVMIIDSGSLIFQIIFLVAGIFYIVAQWKRLNAIDLLLAIVMIFAAGIVVKTVNLLVLLLVVEILSISAYAFTAKQPTGDAKEAGLKYIIFGAASTAIFLFGISLLYGLTGDFNINSEVFTENLLQQDGLVLLFVFLFVMGGLFFKITAVPFHLWAPDVYQSIPAPLTAFFSVVPKIAVIGFMVKLVIVMNLYGLVEIHWRQLLGGVAILTMTVGNVAALAQKNPLRMLAYSSVAHTGFLLFGIVAFQLFALHSVIFYSAIYLFMNFSAFLLIYFYRMRFGLVDTEDFSGKMALAPFHGVVMVIVMIALTGLPPTAGFTAKLFIFSGLFQSYQDTGLNFYWLMLIAGIVNTVISLFYYLKIPYFLIFKSSVNNVESREENFYLLNFLIVILVLPLLILFIWPGILMDWINMVKFAL